MGSWKIVMGSVILLILSGCAKPQIDPWPKRLQWALSERQALSGEAQKEYEEGFANGATMVHEALKAGIRPFRPVLGGRSQAPHWQGAAPEGVKVEAVPEAAEVDSETGLLTHPATGGAGSAYAKGQVDGFNWALSAIGQALVRPRPEPPLPQRWSSWADPQEQKNLVSGDGSLRVRWARGFLGWEWLERGFPPRRNWRPWGTEAPLRTGLGGRSLWVESPKGRALALDLESGGILSVKPAPQEASDADLEGSQDPFTAYMEEVRREFQSPEFQRSLEGLRKKAESGNAADLFAVAKRLTGMGEEADREAFGWYLKAAEKGSAEAMLRVGVQLFHGKSTSMDRVAAKTWLERAIQAGHPNAAAVQEMLFGSGN